MSKIIIVIVIVVLLLGAGYLLISKKSTRLTAPQVVQQQEKAISPQETAVSSSVQIPFNAQDNLDEAIQDLDQLNQF